MRLGKPTHLGGGLFLLVLVTLGLILPTYWVYLLSTVAITAIIARSIGLVTHQAGIITLCQMSFAALGGWAVSYLAIAWPTAPFPLLVLIGGTVTAPVGLLIGIATTRVRGVELAVVTVGFATALDLVLRQGSFPGVGEGTPVIPSAPFDDPRWFFALAWALLIVLQIGIRALSRSVHGLGWTAVRVSERAAAALGVRVGGTKTSAFALGALFAGIAGGLLAGQYGLLTTAVFTPLTSMVHLVTAVLCGASVFGGAVLAGVFVVFIPELLRRIGLPLDAANALLALGAFDVLRRGGGGLVEKLNDQLQERAFRNTRVTCQLLPVSDERLQVGAMQPDGAALQGETVKHQTLQAACLHVDNLTVAFGDHRVLEAVNLTVEHEEVHALIGPNGAGKSTLVDAVTGFLPSYEGRVSLDGKPIERFGPRERARLGIRRTFQHVHAIDAITVENYLKLAAGAAGSERIPAVREFLDLPDGGVPIRLMDVGSRRILEIAGALASKPEILLLDEPAAGLGEAESRALAERVRQIPAVFGCAVLLIEHDMGFVRVASTRVTILDDGRLLTSGAVSEVLDDPRVIAAYLGQETAS
ncbi:ATP-binding cassette domain-containing protein [Cryobacterium sp. Y11]|uniref:branched-chain amino acid ABC transporter ATP-binding protein/permease n=1 Tax=Cryobacterium sp. Y11 TaxID=2045016 RepID=UPI000CE2BB96|nr:ATP-binding cassette domain-containing protein [Cryobacterium sp. Y11]